MRECIFCKIIAGTAPCSEVYADEDILAFMDIHPFRPGHVLVIPREHHQYIGELPPGRAEQIMAVGTRVAAALRESGLPCRGMHMLLNDGPAANQTVPHVHLHVIPRAGGDIAKLVLQLAKHPVVGLFRPRAREVLDEHARLIRAQL